MSEPQLQGSDSAAIRMVLCPCGALADAEHPARLIHRSNCVFAQFKEREVEVVPLADAEALADALADLVKFAPETVSGQLTALIWKGRDVVAVFRAVHPKAEEET